MKQILLLTTLLISTVAYAQKTLKSDTLAFIINEQNTIFVKAVLNDVDTLNLNFDTGTTELVLTNDVLKSKLKSKVELYNTFNTLKIGNTVYKTKIYDAVLAGHGTDGRFGWDLFKDKVVELNYDKNLMIIHHEFPKNALDKGGFSKLKMDFYKNLFFVYTEIKQNGITKNDLFLFDTGFQRTAMLDNDLLKKENFPTEKMRVIKKMIMKGAQGNEVPIVTASLNTLKIGKFKLKNIPVQITTANKPFKGKDIHILGNETLKRFNTFLDFQNNIVYLKPNKLFNDNYIDAKVIKK